MSRLTASMRMSTQAELLSGVTILSASLLMHAVSAVSQSGVFKDLFGILSVLFLMAGIGIVGVGLAHRVTRAEKHEPNGAQSELMTTSARLATGATIGIGIGSLIGSFFGDALPVAIGTAIGAAAGAALGVRSKQP
jgi:hypothetical protein